MNAAAERSGTPEPDRANARQRKDDRAKGLDEVQGLDASEGKGKSQEGYCTSKQKQKIEKCGYEFPPPDLRRSEQAGQEACEGTLFSFNGDRSTAEDWRHQQQDNDLGKDDSEKDSLSDVRALNLSATQAAARVRAEIVDADDNT